MQIESISLRAADLDALEVFYGKCLGLPVTRGGEGNSLLVAIGSAHLRFQPEANFTGRYHFAFNIPENRLAAARDFLQERRIPLIADGQGETTFDFDFWDAHTLYFYDPAGNIAEFIARHELPNALPDTDTLPFSPQEILNISEVGLPADDVPALAAFLTERLSIAAYRETSPTFMPLGDANGLVILVPVGRVWYPDTGIAAEALPVQAVIQNGAGAYFSISGLPYRVVPL